MPVYYQNLKCNGDHIADYQIASPIHNSFMPSVQVY